MEYYDIRIMSVNNQTFHQLQQDYQRLQNYITTDIHHFRNYLAQMQALIMSKLTNSTHGTKYQSHSFSHQGVGLSEELRKMHVQNEQLKKELLSSQNSCNELKMINERLQKQNELKQQKVKELVAEVQQIKLYMKQLQDINKNDNVVNFDDEDDEQIQERNNGLETIKEVSQYDFSVTMSMKSFNSEFQDEEFSLENQRILSMKSSQDCLQNNKQENYQIQNYQDALEILKNYNSGFGTIMTKKQKNPLYDSQAKENIPTLGLNNTQQNENGQKKARNGTMAKIKRMKKIQNLDLESGYSVKSQKQPFGVIQLNEAASEDSISKQESRASIQSQQKKKDSMMGGESISSTRIKSRITEQVISLQSQIKHLNQALAQINLQLQKPKTISTKDMISLICYQGGYEYKGNCDGQEKPHGFGKLMHKNQIIYQGEWRNGKLHGWGKLILLPLPKSKTKRIVSVDGNFRSGVVEGTVVCVFTTGEKFMGVIKNGNIEEQGTFVSEKGILTGHWQSNNLVFLI